MPDEFQEIIQTFHMMPHPEGGWYVRTSESKKKVLLEDFLNQPEAERAICSAILYLLNEDEFSAFHRIKSDECWHFYDGGPLELFVLSESEGLKVITLGKDWRKGHSYQFIVPAGCWFAARPAKGSVFSLLGCTVAPEFKFEDLELANPDELAEKWPQFESLIRELCR
ncbi:MAG: cupin domain-containing protein [Chitinophagaceae bacterium]|nr:cupin domain-containing protein [Chitinophagaceae bacterium]